MIKNKKQLLITKSQLNKLKDALLQSAKSRVSRNPRIYKAMILGLKSQIQELEEEIVEYENLIRCNNIVLHGLEELPLGLIKVRIAKNLTQEELAQKLHLKPQQIQRYEKTNYSGVKFERLVQIWKALGINLKHGIRILKNSPRRAS